MSSGGFSWKTFLGSLILFAGTGAAAAWFGATYLSESHKGEQRYAVLIVVAAIAFTGALVLSFAISRATFRFQAELLRTIRRRSLNENPAPAATPWTYDLALVSSAIDEMRGRFAAQLDATNRERLTLAALVNQLREGVIVVGADSRIALLNPAAARLLNLDPRGRGEEAFIGQPIERCIPQHDLQAMARRENWPTAHPYTEPGRIPPLPWDAPASSDETRLQIDSPAGSAHLIVHATDLTLPDGAAGGEAPGRLLVLLDVTELTRTMQIKTDFVANASHELRTPLSTIRAAIETLMSMDLREDADAAGRFITLVDRHSSRLEALVADLLDLARVESPAARFEMRPIEMRELMEELHARVGDALARKELRWETDLSGCAKRSIVASSHLLNLVLDNLIDNAIKFTDPGGRVGVTWRDGPGWVSFEVSDTGCGIPEVDQERVFERFYQVERARSGGERGTGLGLSIVRHAVSAMDGSITLHSETGKGTRFRVTIPQAQIPPRQAIG